MGEASPVLMLVNSKLLCIIRSIELWLERLGCSQKHGGVAQIYGSRLHCGWPVHRHYGLGNVNFLEEVRRDSHLAPGLVRLGSQVNLIARRCKRWLRPVCFQVWLLELREVDHRGGD